MTLDPAARTRLVDSIHQLRGSVVGSVMARGREEDLAEYGLSLTRSGLLSEAPELPTHAYALDPTLLPLPKRKFGRKQPMPTQDWAPPEDVVKMLAYLEKSVRLVNREIIHAQIPGLTRERFIEFAAAVAKLRADYLNSAMACFLDDASEAADLAALRQKRALFEEGVKAYEALHRALERGYIDPQETGKA
ncbi:MAG: hypothetical protein ACK5X0_07145 [Rhodospirillales bacterium]